MADIKHIKHLINEYYNGQAHGSVVYVAEVFGSVPELIAEIEQLRRDLKEMYAVTKEMKYHAKR